MAECAFHPGVETEVRCAECLRPICPRDMVETPVGYKCPICSKPKRSEYFYVKPKQLVGGAALGLLVGVGGGFLLGAFHLTFFIVSFLWGSLVGEAVRRGAGGHRGPIMATVAAVAVVLGALIGGMSLFGTILGVIGAVTTLSWTWGR